MMVDNLYSRSILDLPRFKSALEHIVRRSIRNEYKLLVVSAEEEEPDWNFALLCASALTSQNLEEANEAVLRVAQGCLHSLSSTPEQKRSALLLLERGGNQPAISLAIERNLALPPAMHAIPPQLALDAAARRFELTIPTVREGDLLLNPFQKAFWEAASSNRWLSISAPTSAGKSHIVRTWLDAKLSLGSSYRAVYIAPTRALVEEVAAMFRSNLSESTTVRSMPWSAPEAESSHSVHVLTQERLHILLDMVPDFMPDFIFIDEAQKIGEGSRGILLSQVIDACVHRNPEVQLVFASPLTENPEILVTSAPPFTKTDSIVGEAVTVNQNLIFVNQVSRKTKQYSLRAIYKGSEHDLGILCLPQTPGTSQRVPFIAAELGKAKGGNLIYANGPAQAEKYAGQVFAALGDAGHLDSQELTELIEFSKGAIHERFLLARYLERGVAFHYGDMPLILKTKIERLFKIGEIKFLVCTSTLLEGVNLPCRNIFIRNPKKGSNSQDMTLADFWNLAGRAGRWGKEFQGNVFCIDTDKSSVWHDVPKERRRLPIVRAADRVLHQPAVLLGYIDSGAPKASASVPADLESFFSFLSASFTQGRSLGQLVGVQGQADHVDAIDQAVSRVIGDLSIDFAFVSRHAGISPASMQRFVDDVRHSGDVGAKVLVSPFSDDAYKSYADALRLVDMHLGGSFNPDSRRHSLARLIVNWMKGLPLSVIIENKARWRRQRDMEVNYPKLIRDVMGDVEDIVRFEAPKYLACYADLVNYVAAEQGVEIDESLGDVRLMLELGVPRRTDMSFIGLGLSRSTVMAISPLVLDPELSEIECAQWLKSVDLAGEDLPSFAKTEVRRLLDKDSLKNVTADPDDA